MMELKLVPEPGAGIDNPPYNRTMMELKLQTRRRRVIKLNL